jgi:hypothetical protein
MPVSQNLFATPPATADEEERRLISNALENRNFLLRTFHSSDDVLQLSSTVIPGSRFDDANQAGKLLLNNVRKHPQFIQLIEQLDIDDPHWTMVRDNGEVYEACETIENTGIYIKLIVITDQLFEIESLRTDMELLSRTAELTGGIVSSSNLIPLRNWLTFQQLDKPQTHEELENLIDCLAFTFPAPPKYGNYWGYCDETQDVQLIVEPSQYPAIMQAVKTLMAEQNRHNEPVINYLTDVVLQTWSGALVMDDPRRAWELLMETPEARSLARACFDALEIPDTEPEQALTQVTCSRLLLAGVVLDLEMGSDERIETHRDLRYNPQHVHENPSEARARLEQQFIQINAATPFAAHLATELVLAGQSPEFLIGVPPTFVIGSPGWVMLRKAVLLSERLAPGLSLTLTYQQLMKLAALAPLSDEQKALHQLLSLQCVMDWAKLNELTPSDDQDLSVEQIATAAMTHYSAYAKELDNALSAIAATPVSRRKLARQTLLDADIERPDEVFQSPLNGGARFADSVINIYLSDQRPRRELFSTVDARNLHDVHPGLLDLEPINDLYGKELKLQHEQFKSGTSTMIRLAFSQLDMSDREALTLGQSTLYLVRGNRNIPDHTADDFSPHGMVIMSRHKSKIRCFELFPLQGICRRSDRLAEVFATASAFNEHTGEFDDATNGDTGNFPRLTYLENIVTEHAAYFQGKPSREREDPDINQILPRKHWQLDEYGDIREFGMLLDRLGEFAASDEPALWYTSSMTSFYSDRLKTIADFIAKNNPPITYDEYYKIGYDATDYEVRQETYKRIANMILNIFIPFKGCIEQLSSKDPDERSGAAFTCVMDVLAVAFVFIGAAGALAKAVASSTRLLSLGRVAASTLVAIFNPLDGVPQLVRGAGKLIGKSVLKLSHYGQSVSMVGARQLQRLTGTGTGSYDLVKALSKTGAAAEIRMTLPTVAHGRALLLDDSLDTAQQIVTRLTDKNIPLPKGAATAELEHLFNNAVSETTRKLQNAQELEALIGKAAVDDLLKTVMTKNGIDLAGARSAGNGDYSSLLGTVTEFEVRKVKYMKAHQQNLLHQDLGKAPYNGVLPDSSYNPERFTDDAQRAGAWIVHASNSPGNDLDSIATVLREYAVNNKNLTDAALIRELHVRIAPATSDVVRVGINDKKYASSISGFAVMQDHLKTLDTAHEHFSKQLLGAVVGFHGFGDGNGRTGRALYAISELRRNRFNALSKESFSALHGLD